MATNLDIIYILDLSHLVFKGAGNGGISFHMLGHAKFSSKPNMRSTSRQPKRSCNLIFMLANGFALCEDRFKVVVLKHERILIHFHF